MKRICYFLICLLPVMDAHAQIIIANPNYGFVSGRNTLNVDTVTLTDTSTNLHMTLIYKAGTNQELPKSIYIKTPDSDLKYYARSVAGIPFGHISLPDSIIQTPVHFILSFPRLPSGAKTIDFADETPGGDRIFDIGLTPPASGKLPPAIYGEWYDSANGHLQYAFYKQFAVLDNKIWHYNKVSFSGGKGYISIQNGSKISSLTFSGITNIRYAITKNQEPALICSKFLGECHIDHSMPAYRLPIIKNDSFIYAGYIKDYNERIGSKTIAIFQDDIIAGTQDQYLATIDKNGYFFIKIPMYHPQRLFIRSELLNDEVYVEPGTTLFSILTSDHLIYAGSAAPLADEIRRLYGSCFSNSSAAKDLLSFTTAQPYKEYNLNLEKYDLAQLDTIHASGDISDRGYQIFKLEIQYHYAADLMFYNQRLYNLFLQQHSNDKAGNFKPVKLTAAYFDFIDTGLINNETSLLSTSFNSFINYLRYIDLTFPAPDQPDNAAIIKKSVNNRADNSPDGYFITRKQQIAFLDKGLKDSLGLNKGLATDLLASQILLDTVVNNLHPFPPSQFAHIRTCILHPLVFQHMYDRNKQVQLRLNANKTSSGYTVNTTPKTTADHLFDQLMAKYKGKVVYVDFWATWCKPCLSSIKDIAPLKESMKDKNVVFVYITEQSSPLETWKNMLPSIKGEHYRLNKDEWNYLSNKFNITGIPHTVLVDKAGKIVNPSLGFLDNDKIEALIQSALAIIKP